MNVHKYSDKDFTEAMLPHDRKQVFFDCVKMRFGVIVKAGLVLLLVLLPYFAVRVYGDVLTVGIYERYGDDPEAALQAGRALKTVMALVQAPCLGIASVGFAGVMKVLRQLVWGEGVFFHEDFWSGVRQNGGYFALTFVLAGLVHALDRFVLTINFSVQFLLYAPLAVSIFVLLPMAFFILTQTTIYRNKYGTLVKNSGYFFIKTVPQSWLFVLIAALPFALEFLPFFIVKYVVWILLAIFALPLFLTARFLFDCSVYDKFINKTQYPDIYDKGVYRLDK